MGTIRSGQIPLRFRSTVVAAARAVPEVCSVGARLAIRVPTVGLHDKGGFTKGGKYSSHADGKALKAAKALYLQVLPSIARPVAPPLALEAHFVLLPPSTMEHFDGVLPFTQKPDLSNLIKVFEDCLRMKGWMVDDAEVTRHEEGKWLSFDEHLQGVWFNLRTRGAGTPDLEFPYLQGSDAKAFELRYGWRGGEAAEHR